MKADYMIKTDRDGRVGIRAAGDGRVGIRAAGGGAFAFQRNRCKWKDAVEEEKEYCLLIHVFSKFFFPLHRGQTFSCKLKG